MNNQIKKRDFSIVCCNKETKFLQLLHLENVFAKNRKLMCIQRNLYGHEHEFYISFPFLSFSEKDWIWDYCMWNSPKQIPVSNTGSSWFICIRAVNDSFSPSCSCITHSVLLIPTLKTDWQGHLLLGEAKKW